MNRKLILAVIALTVLFSGALVSRVAAQTAAKPAANTIAVTEKGFEPASITVKANAPTTITFVRKTDKTCGTSVVIPDYNITKDLPLNQPVTVNFTPKKAGDIAFTCGMKMLKGTIVAQ